MYKASIHDPAGDGLLTIEATSQALLRKEVSNEVNNLRKRIVDLLVPATIALVLNSFALIVAINLPPFGLLVWLLLTVAYLRAAPLILNPLLDIWYLRKRMYAWEEELERISAPDTQTI